MKLFLLLFVIAFGFLMRGRLLLWVVERSQAVYAVWLKLEDVDKFHVAFVGLFLLAEFLFVCFVWSR